MSANDVAYPPPSQQTEAVKEIMAKVISMQSADKYAGQNATFAMFCYESDELRDIFLENWFIENLGNIANQNAKKNMQKVAAQI